MKNLMMITYRVKSDYKAMHDFILSICPENFCFSLGFIIVETDLQIQQLHKLIQSQDKRFEHFIIEFEMTTYYGVLPTEFWKWFKERKVKIDPTLTKIETR